MSLRKGSGDFPSAELPPGTVGADWGGIWGCSKYSSSSWYRSRKILEPASDPIHVYRLLCPGDGAKVHPKTPYLYSFVLNRLCDRESLFKTLEHFSYLIFPLVRFVRASLLLFKHWLLKSKGGTLELFCDICSDKSTTPGVWSALHTCSR
jgi:hypothetical protein